MAKKSDVQSNSDGMDRTSAGLRNVLFDEIDSLAGKRGVEAGTKVTERVLNQLLAEMDGLEDLNDVLVIGATNRPDMLDTALLRPGRFDRILLVNISEEEDRLKILQIKTSADAQLFMSS